MNLAWLFFIPSGQLLLCLCPQWMTPCAKGNSISFLSLLSITTSLEVSFSLRSVCLVFLVRPRSLTPNIKLKCYIFSNFFLFWLGYIYCCSHIISKKSNLVNIICNITLVVLKPAILYKKTYFNIGCNITWVVLKPEWRQHHSKCKLV